MTVDASRRQRPPKAEGTISSVFTSLTNENATILPPRFSDLKNGMWNDGLIQTWREVLGELEMTVKEIERKGKEVRSY